MTLIIKFADQLARGRINPWLAAIGTAICQ